MLEEFDRYVSYYDLNNKFIKSKYNHSYRVMVLSKKYAKMLNFSDSDIELAGIVGLLHDIGRFEQYKRYNSFNDIETMDHADYGILELFDNNKIINFTDRVDDYDIIRFAIKYHNKLFIPDVDDERMLKFARLIRDVDKIDIIYYFGYLGEYNHKANKDKLSKEVMADIKNHRSVNRKNINNNNDNLAVLYAFAFDIYNDVCLDAMKKNLKYYYEQIGGGEIFNEIYDEVIRYIDSRMINSKNM